ncbi:hypothetical protein [Actinoplanes sp. CA-252034]|uniref:hypothetical protein n=1 Tax=Actinoplanes sp. CA-252034 TaxID=3239906 RepID=UPI003D98D333
MWPGAAGPAESTLDRLEAGGHPDLDGDRAVVEAQRGRTSILLITCIDWINIDWINIDWINIDRINVERVNIDRFNTVRARAH